MCQASVVFEVKLVGDIFFFFQAEDGIRDTSVTGVQTCALPIFNSRAQLEKIQGLVESGVEEGAQLYQPECVLPERGFWFPPSLFTNVSQSYRIAREEIFGPVLSVLTFRTPAEAVEKANNTPYGLSAGVWTDKGSRILWMAERMRAGVVWANTFNRFDPTSPFGGYQESGFGREGGRHGLAAYVDLR